MKITRRQLRTIISEAAKMMAGDAIDTFDKVESLVPGDQITKNGQPITVVDVDSFSGTLTFTVAGKSTLKDLDYWRAVRYDDDPTDMIPEIQLAYLEKGSVPANLRQPRQAKGPGKSYSVMD
tara:strand:+ start:122 stop:487 length:366 start_codon:yes stop_codon:yes gene_type:complete